MPAGPGARVLALVHDADAVDQHVLHAARVAQRVLERRDGIQSGEVEDDHVGGVARAQQPTVTQAEVRGRHAGHLADGVFQTHYSAFAYVVRQVVDVPGEVQRV